MRALLPLLACGLLSACASTAGFRQAGFTPAEVQTLVFAPPLTSISVIEKGNQPTPSQEATSEAARILRTVLLRHQAELHLKTELPIPDSLQQAAGREISQAIRGIEGHQRLSGGANLPVLDYLLEAQGERFLVVTANRGFTREQGNYGKQLTKSLGIGLLTMGMLVPVSVKAKSNLSYFIYDRQQKAIVYYNHTPPNAEHEPLNEASVEQQLRTMLAKDFPLH